MYEIFILLGLIFGFIVIILQIYYLQQLKKIEKKFLNNMIKAIERLEWREK
jgi:hypothetical protein